MADANQAEWSPSSAQPIALLTLGPNYSGPPSPVSRPSPPPPHRHSILPSSRYPPSPAAVTSPFPPAQPAPPLPPLANGNADPFHRPADATAAAPSGRRDLSLPISRRRFFLPPARCRCLSLPPADGNAESPTPADGNADPAHPPSDATAVRRRLLLPASATSPTPAAAAAAAAAAASGSIWANSHLIPRSRPRKQLYRRPSEPASLLSPVTTPNEAALPQAAPRCPHPMSLAAEAPSPSPSSSSGSDDFAALLDAELELASAADSASLADPSWSDDDDDDADGEEEAAADKAVVVQVEAVEQTSTKRRRVEEHHQDRGTADGHAMDAQIKICPPHPGFFGGLCFRCGKGQEKEDVSAVPFGYIHKGLRLGTSEIDRLRGADLKNLLRERKLVLILDLDHTLINSTKLNDISPAENALGIQTAGSKDDPNRSLFTLESMQMLTKLRPFVHNFLKEASNMFELYIYTMGDKAYAIEIAKILDPGNVYFHSKVISNSDCTQRHQKGLDVILGAESVAVILDDTESVWQKHKQNLILMERYLYFASGCRQFGFHVKSLSESMQDERESDGALATILDALKRIHEIFFDSAVESDLSSRDVRQVIKSVRKEVLQGCKLVFSRVFPNNSRPQDETIWKMAEQLGAVCCADVDTTVTHVVALDIGTEKARWAADNKKFLVHPRWIEAAHFRWKREREEDFPVANPKGNCKEKENAAAASTDPDVS